MPCCAYSRCRNGHLGYLTAFCLIVRYGLYHILIQMGSKLACNSIRVQGTKSEIQTASSFDHIVISDLFHPRQTERQTDERINIQPEASSVVSALLYV